MRMALGILMPLFSTARMMEIGRNASDGRVEWLYIGSIVYVPAAYFVEVTILLLIARVFAAEERVAKGIYIFILMLLFAYTPVHTINIMICIPIRAY
ncbi:hypothetical protein BN1708_001340 [Verticillium longisporum]|uniref:Rhodopsin domain-containing protein n=1 Tax=Verticillium longisporum TaxID=100787 RepID=A0A0G4MNC7_VERLO|nr:hypothetical protein BN1708_001340 [Verticillium longisporum]